MIHGAHVIIYSKDSEADRAFFRDVLKYTEARLAAAEFDCVRRRVTEQLSDAL